MSTSEHGEITDLIDRTWQQMGGRGTKADVAAHLAGMLPDALGQYLIEQGLSAKIGGYFRRRSDDGLAQAPAIDEHGTHAQLDLLDESEYRYVIAQHVSAGKGEFRIAKALSGKAFERLGVRIDLSDPMGEQAAS